MSISESNPFESPTSPNTRQPAERSLILRIWFGFLWFVLIWIVSNFMIGAVLGGIAGSQAESPEAAAQAGAEAAQVFFEKYRFIILAVQVATTLALCWFQALPGTRKVLK